MGVPAGALMSTPLWLLEYQREQPVYWGTGQMKVPLPTWATLPLGSLVPTTISRSTGSLVISLLRMVWLSMVPSVA